MKKIKITLLAMAAVMLFTSLVGCTGATSSVYSDLSIPPAVSNSMPKSTKYVMNITTVDPWANLNSPDYSFMITSLGTQAGCSFFGQFVASVTADNDFAKVVSAGEKTLTTAQDTSWSIPVATTLAGYPAYKVTGTIAFTGNPSRLTYDCIFVNVSGEVFVTVYSTQTGSTYDRSGIDAMLKNITFTAIAK